MISLQGMADFLANICMLSLESQRFPVLGEVSFCVRTLPNRQRNVPRSYYYIVYYLRSMLQVVSDSILLCSLVFFSLNKKSRDHLANDYTNI